jgi:hypothetical protein
MIPTEQRITENAGRAPLFGFEPLNVGLLVAGLVAIGGGYILLSRGSTVAAPLLLVLGYAVLVPAALLVGLRGSRDPAGGGGE